MRIPNQKIPDHYNVLGLPSGEEGSKLTMNEISKAYKQKALILHPDKNPNDPNATCNFTQLKNSFEILKNESSRKLFDDLMKLRGKDSNLSGKRRRMASDLEKRERNWGGVESRAEEERIMRKLDEEVRNIREMLTKKKKKKKKKGNAKVMDKSKMAKVSWEKGGVNGDYSAERLRELFMAFEKSVLEKLKKAS